MLGLTFVVVWCLATRKDDDYLHDAEGSDDMPAHVKSSLMGCSLTIPSTYAWKRELAKHLLSACHVVLAVTGGKLALGMWQVRGLCSLVCN